MVSEAGRYRNKATECLTQADTVSDPLAQASLREAADAWLLLATLLEGPVYRGGLAMTLMDNAERQALAQKRAAHLEAPRSN